MFFTLLKKTFYLVFGHYYQRYVNNNELVQLNQFMEEYKTVLTKTYALVSEIHENKTGRTNRMTNILENNLGTLIKLLPEVSSEGLSTFANLSESSLELSLLLFERVKVFSMAFNSLADFILFSSKAFHNLFVLPSSLFTLVTEKDTLADTLGSLVARAHTTHGLTSLFAAVLKTLSEQDERLLNKPKILKATQSVVEALGDRCFSLILSDNNTHFFADFSRSRHFQLRSASVYALGKALEHAKLDGTKLEQGLSLVAKRVLDLNGFVRTKAVSALGAFFENSRHLDIYDPSSGATVDQHLSLTMLLVDRLFDKNSFVRKQVLVALVKNLERNQHGPSVAVAEFENGVENPATEYCKLMAVVVEKLERLLQNEVFLFSANPGGSISEMVVLARRLVEFRATGAERLLVVLLDLLAAAETVESPTDTTRKVIASVDAVFCDQLAGENSVLLASVAKLCREANRTAVFNMVGRWLDSNKVGSELLDELWQSFVSQKQITKKEDGVVLLQLYFHLESDTLEKNKDVAHFRRVVAASLKLLAEKRVANFLRNKLRENLAQFVSTFISLSFELDVAAKTELLVVVEQQLLKPLSSGETYNMEHLLEYLNAVQKLLTLFFVLVESPEGTVDTILKKLFGRLTQPTGANEQELIRFLSVLGHVGLNYLGYLERQRELFKRNKHVLPASGKVQLANFSGFETLSAATARSKVEASAEHDATVLSALDFEIERHFDRLENSLLAAPDKNPSGGLLGLFAPLAVLICSRPDEFSSQPLQTAASLSLSKLMLVSRSFAVNNVQLLVSKLESTPDPALRHNIVVALGDLVVRFPNEMAPWVSYLFGRTKKGDRQETRTVLFVLAKLALSDMLKAKEVLSNIAHLLANKDTELVLLVQFVFRQLDAKNSNNVYNSVADIVSSLVAADADWEARRAALDFVLGFVTKEQQVGNLVERFLKRTLLSEDKELKRTLVFCLTRTSLTARTLKKLLEGENWKCIASLLKEKDELVFGWLLELGNKIKSENKELQNTYRTKVQQTYEGKTEKTVET